MREPAYYIVDCRISELFMVIHVYQSNLLGLFMVKKSNFTFFYTIEFELSISITLKLLDDFLGKSDHCAPTRALVALCVQCSQSKKENQL